MLSHINPKVLVVLSFCFFAFTLKAQWQKSNTFLTTDINAAQFVTDNTVYRIGYDNFYISNDYGNQWSSINSLASNFIGYDMSFIDSTNGVITGIEGSYTSVIKVTHDGGYTWTTNYSYAPTSFNPIRRIRMFDANFVYALAENKYLLKSNNGGTNWQVQHTFSNSIFDVFFSSPQTGYASTDSFIFKTIDGGNSWNKIYTNDLQNTCIYFLNDTTGVIGSAYKTLKTIDGGVTWTAANCSNMIPTSIHFTSIDTGYITGQYTSNFVMKTVNGGLLWEKQLLPNSSGTINDIHFRKNRGVVCGNGGRVFYTFNGGGCPIPNVSFTYTAPICDTVVYLQNTSSSPNLTYVWKFNQQAFSTGSNASYKNMYVSPASSNNIILIGKSSCGADTIGTSINTPVSPFYPKIELGSALNTKVCYLNSGYITLSNLKSSNKYFFYLNGNVFDSIVNTNVASITKYFQLPYDSTRFVVKLKKANGCMPEDSLVAYMRIVNLDFSNNLILDTNMCVGLDTLDVTINNSVPNVSYFTQYQYNPPNGSIWYTISDTIKGTGGTIHILSKGYSSIKIVSTDSICSSQKYANIVFRDTVLNFIPDKNCGILSDTFYITNKSTADSYHWISDAFATFISDTSTNPKLLFNNTGVKPISITASSIQNCNYATKTKYVTVGVDAPDDSVGTACIDSSIIKVNNYSKVLDLAIDRFGNKYSVGYKYSNYSVYQGGSGFITKSDRYGKVIYTKVFNNIPSCSGSTGNYSSSFITAVTTDNSGNVYFAGNIFGKNCFQFDTSTFQVNSSSPLRKSFLFKLDSLGSTRWMVYNPNSTWGGFISDVEYYNDSTLLFFGDGDFKFKDTTIYNGGLFQISTNGFFKKSFALVGYPMGTTQLDGTYSWNTFNEFATFPKIKVTNKRTINLIGQFRDSLKISYNWPQTISNTIKAKLKGEFSVNNVKIDLAGFTLTDFRCLFSLNPYSVKDIFTNQLISPDLFDIDDNNNFYCAINTDQVFFKDTIIPNNVLSNVSLMARYSIFKLDSLGNTLWCNRYIEPLLLNPSVFTPVLTGIRCSHTNQDIYLAGKFVRELGLISTNNSPLIFKSPKVYQSFLACSNNDGNFKWAKKIIDTCNYNNTGGIRTTCRGNIYVVHVTQTTPTFTNSIFEYNENGDCNVNTACALDTIWASVSIQLLNAQGCSKKNALFKASTLNGGNNPLFQWYVNGVLTGSNKDTITIANAQDGDSIQCLLISNDLNVLNKPTISNNIIIRYNPIYQSVNKVICKGQSFLFNGKLLDQLGTYIDTVSSINGCDSIITLHLSVNNPSTVTLNQTLCSGNSYTFNGKTLSTPGTYIDTLISTNGCDSIITLHLSFTNTASTSFIISICSGSSYLFNGIHIKATGTYTDTFSSINGCDSIVTLHLDVLPKSSDSIDYTICEGDNFTFNGKSLNQAGVYLDSLVNINGCDSIVYLNLSIHPKPNPVIQLVGEDSLSCSTPFTIYQWLKNGIPLQDVTNQNILATSNGTYSVIVTDSNGCSDTSNALNLLHVSVRETTKAQFVNVYPNPFNYEISINSDLADVFQFKLSDITGRLITENHFKFQHRIDTKTLSSGIYYLHIFDMNRKDILIIKLVKEQN